jgi:hypothetical protein
MILYFASSSDALFNNQGEGGADIGAAIPDFIS